MSELMNHEAQQLWQSQPVEGTKMSVEAIRLRAGKFERRIARRNLRESIASGVVIVAFTYFFATAPNLPFRLTWGLFIAGMLWITVQLWRKGTPRSMPADVAASTGVSFFRSELERQRELLESVWLWYLGPLVPGYIALNFACVLGAPHPMSWTKLAALDAIFVAVFVAVWKMNQRAARCLRRSIEELSANS